MTYSNIPSLQENPSLLGFGCMRFPLRAHGNIDEEITAQMLHTALEAGVTYIDTAYPYHGGQSEPVLGKLLQKYPRSSYTLATKLPLWAIETTKDAAHIFAEQLERLQTDYIDFYLLHAVNRSRWEKVKKLGVLDLLEKLQAEGKIRHLGFSFHDDYACFAEILSYRKWDFCQIQYNYMDIDEQAGSKGYALTEKLGVPLVIMEPVKGGSLAALPADIAAVFTAQNPAASCASWALRWVASHPNVKVVLSGMSTPQQLADNLATFAPFTPLTQTENEAVNTVRAAIRARQKNGCTACRYCMPCPAGVNIPRNFALWNQHAMLGSADKKAEWATLGTESATACVQCGQCEAQCPQNIAIRANLQQVIRDLSTIKE